uniref:uncharacterized protein LOC122609067 n=1 Tax=Erigeron canadensis TaxID=72917 RepID=UPI001CB88E60|nr:uncharacterized protein LOC122609067 [Erigeron canadensis]
MKVVIEIVICFSLKDSVSRLISEGAWSWPADWNDKFQNVQIPTFVQDKQDELSWKNSAEFQEFSVTMVWETIRPRGLEVPWFHVVWFTHCIPKHAFHLWLVFRPKLKTQDVLSSWGIRGCADVPTVCALCELQPDSHDHVFFECSYATQVWKGICDYAELDHYCCSLGCSCELFRLFC